MPCSYGWASMRIIARSQTAGGIDWPPSAHICLFIVVMNPTGSKPVHLGQLKVYKTLGKGSSPAVSTKYSDPTSLLPKGPKPVSG